MKKEYCDKCGKQIEIGKLVEEEGLKSRKDTRIEISVNTASEPFPEHELNALTDVLCPECAREWKWTE